MNDNDTDVLQMNVSDFPRLSLSLHYELADHPNSSVDNYRKLYCIMGTLNWDVLMTDRVFMPPVLLFQRQPLIPIMLILRKWTRQRPGKEEPC